jgi:hypothetical protein
MYSIGREVMNPAMKCGKGGSVSKISSSGFSKECRAAYFDSPVI